MKDFSLNITEPDLLSAIATSAKRHGRTFEQEATSILKTATQHPCDTVEEDLEESLKELRAIHDIGLLANSSLDVKLVLTRIMEGTMAALEAPVGMIFERNIHTGQLQWMAQKGLSKDFVKNYEDRPIQPGEGLTGQIAETGQPIYIREDSSADPRIARAVTAEENLNSFIGVPILADGTVVAVMNILTYPPQWLEKKALSFIESVATYVGTTIRNARLHTDYLEAEKKLHLLFHAIEQSPATVMVTDIDGTIEYTNPKTLRTTGYSSNELIGHNVNIIQACTQREAFFKELWDTINSGKSWRGELCNRKKDGGSYWEAASITPVKDATGTITNFIKVSEDITHLKRLEEELENAKKVAESANEAKSHFLTNMSHELRTPLTAIMGFAGLLKRDPALAESQLEALDIIEHSGEHLLMLVNDLLDIARIESDKLKLLSSNFNLHALLNDAAKTFRLRADSKGIIFTHTISPDIPTMVTGDETRIRQILINLLGNAIKFTQQGKVDLKVYLSSQGICFQVSDTGPGISPEDLNKIFLSFHQAPDHQDLTEGTGLGLAISKKLADLMGGTIRVNSTLGKGSDFYLELQLPEVEGDTAFWEAETKPIANYKGPRRTILIADDATQVRALMVKLLTRYGFQVAEASNGQECIEQVKKIKPDAILMDIVMPGLDGLEATRQIRQLDLGGSRPVILAVTAKAFSEDVANCHHAGCDDFLSKPVKIDKLLDKLAKLLELEWTYSDQTTAD